jgi:hypothetical protein
MLTGARPRESRLRRNDEVVSGVRVILAAIVAVAVGTTLGCTLESPRYVVADPQSVPSRSDAYWQVRPRASAGCAQSAPDKEASLSEPAAKRN